MRVPLLGFPSGDGGSNIFAGIDGSSSHSDDFDEGGDGACLCWLLRAPIRFFLVVLFCSFFLACRGERDRWYLRLSDARQHICWGRGRSLASHLGFSDWKRSSLFPIGDDVGLVSNGNTGGGDASLWLCDWWDRSNGCFMHPWMVVWIMCRHRSDSRGTNLEASLQFRMVGNSVLWGTCDLELGSTSDYVGGGVLKAGGDGVKVGSNAVTVGMPSNLGGQNTAAAKAWDRISMVSLNHGPLLWAKWALGLGLPELHAGPWSMVEFGKTGLVSPSGEAPSA